MSTETELPVISNATLKHFADTVPVQTVASVKTGRFMVPIPKLDDGEGDLKLPNAKELKALIKSGNVGTSISSAKMEGFPQLVPTDGTNVVIINNISRRQALAMQAIYDDINLAHKGNMDRQALLEFFAAATGISYDIQTNTIQAVPDNIGIHGDQFNQTLETFKARHTRAGMSAPLNEAMDSMIDTGYYQKKRDIYKAYAISGGFIRKAESGSQLEYPETAMIAVGRDGKVSAIHANDVTVSYETEDGKPLVGDDKKLQLPTYPVGQVLLERRGAPERPKTRVVGEG